MNQNFLFSDIKYRQTLRKKTLKTSVLVQSVYVKQISWGSLYLSATLETLFALLSLTLTFFKFQIPLLFMCGMNNLKKNWDSFLHFSLGLNSPPQSCEVRFLSEILKTLAQIKFFSIELEILTQPLHWAWPTGQWVHFQSNYFVQSSGCHI